MTSVIPQNMKNVLSRDLFNGSLGSDFIVPVLCRGGLSIFFTLYQVWVFELT